MKTTFAKSLTKTDALFLPTDSIKSTIKLPDSIKKDLKNLVTKTNFTGKKGSKLNLLSKLDKQVIQINLIGTKNAKNFIKIGSQIAKTAKSQKAENITIYAEDLNNTQIAEIIEGINYTSYTYNQFKKTTHQIKTLKIIKQKVDQKLKIQLKEVEKLSDAISQVRDYVNCPAMDMKPETLADIAKKIAKTDPKIKATILNGKQIEKNGLNLIKAVSSGSNQDPKLIILEYKNSTKNKKPLLIAGKGVTFDAGGLNIKGSGNIETMKMDMGGAATTLGLFQLLTKSNLKLHVIGVIPTVENLVGASAYKPGDIIKAYNGKTIEITNTDAEGRLILADALAYGVKKYKPEAIIDLATLTGACIVALGNTRTGLCSNNPKLRSQILKASKTSRNKVWPLPLDNFHRSKVAGSISDYKNYTSSVGAGASMAAAFLEKFVDKTPWVHLDIAGTAFIESPLPDKPKGATGEPLKLLYHFVKNY